MQRNRKMQFLLSSSFSSSFSSLFSSSFSSLFSSSFSSLFSSSFSSLFSSSFSSSFSSLFSSLFLFLFLSTATVGCCSEEYRLLPGIEGECIDECSPGLVCVDSLCRRVCGDPDDCAEGLGCVDGACMECGGEEDCRTGEGCIDGECLMALKPNGSECTDSAECSSGFCSLGICCERDCSGGCMTCNGTIPGLCVRDERSECNIRYPDDTSSLQDAIGIVQDGGIITITQESPGGIIIETDKNIVIEGEGDVPPAITNADGETGFLVLDAPSLTIRNLQINGGDYGVRVLSSVPVLLDGVHVDGAEVGVEIDHNGVWTPDVLSLILSCDLFFNRTAGLIVRSAMVEIIGARMHGNRRALHVEDTGAFELANSIVSQSHGDFGATFLSSSNVLISGSLFWENNGLGGLVFRNVFDSEVTDSTFKANGTAGIQVLDSEEIDIVSVKFEDHVNTFYNGVVFNSPGQSGVPESMMPEGFLSLPENEESPGETDFDFYDDYHQGNGISINDSASVLLLNVYSSDNEGSGVLIRDSSNIAVWSGGMALNKLGGITADSTDDLWLLHSDVYNNLGTGVQIIGGNSLVEHSGQFNTLGDQDDSYGIGLSVENGTHILQQNTNYDHKLVGLLICGTADAFVYGNSIHGSPLGIARNVGSQSEIGECNNVSCTIANECIDWTTIGDIPPSPPPKSPLPPLEL